MATFWDCKFLIFLLKIFSLCQQKPKLKKQKNLQNLGRELLEDAKGVVGKEVICESLDSAEFALENLQIKV